VKDQLMSDVPVGSFFRVVSISSARRCLCLLAVARDLYASGFTYNGQGVIDERPPLPGNCRPALGLELQLITMDGSSPG